MTALAEKVKEALHIGDFQPTSLEAEERMLSDANDFAPYARRLEKAARQFQKDTRGFLDATGGFLTGAPWPRLWLQSAPGAPAEPQRPAVPERHAHLFTAELHTRLAEAVPLALSAAIEADLLKPLAAWLAAHDAAKERVRRLEARRLEYDATRRRLQSATDRAVDAAAGESRGDPAKAERRLGHAEGEAEPVMEEFEAERASLREHLVWMATAAARLKAYVADTAAAMRDAATSFQIPEGLLEPYPESARAPQAPEHGPQAAATPGAAPSAAGGAPLRVHADVPERVQVEGGVAPQGAGMGGFLVDTLKSVVGMPTGPPGGMKPHPHAHEPHAAGAPHATPAPPAAATTAAPDASAAAPAEVVIPETAVVTKRIVRIVELPEAPPASEGHPAAPPIAADVVSEPPAAGAAAGGAGVAAGAEGADEPPYEAGDREPRPYEGASPAKHHECRMPDDAAMGLGARGRVLSRDLPQPAAGAGAAGAEAEPKFEDEEHKQLLPAMAPTTPAPGHPTRAGAVAGVTEGAGTGTAEGAGEGGGDAGVLGAIKKAMQRDDAPGAPRAKAAQAPAGAGAGADEGEGGLFPPHPELGAAT